MGIPTALLDELLVHRRQGRRAGLVVRHAERHPIVDLRTHHALLLTERGHAMARDGGAALASRLSTTSSTAPVRLRAAHSPVERCAETARGLVQGARDTGIDAVVVGSDVVLGDPFLRDRRRALEHANELQHGFLRAWFDGRVDATVLQPARDAVADQLAAWARHIDDGDDGDVAVLVSHDWNIALVREHVLGVAHETTWPHFLDGVVVVLDGDEVVVHFDGQTGRAPRTTASQSTASQTTGSQTTPPRSSR
jgi:broad specificity phosphatase PhoE